MRGWRSCDQAERDSFLIPRLAFYPRIAHGLGTDYDIPEVCRRFHKDFGALENLSFGYMKLPIRADLAPERLPCSYFG
jgi:hypothetical protein